jgi:hypothetical protein
MRNNVMSALNYSLIYSIQDGHIDRICEEQIYSIHYFFVRQTMTTNSTGQNTAKASVIQVIHVASLDHTQSGPDYPVGLYFAPK